MLSIRDEEAKPCVRLSHRRITLTVRAGSSRVKREAIMHEWHKSLLHDALPELIQKWEPRLGVEVAGYFLQRMKKETNRIHTVVISMSNTTNAPQTWAAM